MASQADFLVDARWLSDHRRDPNLIIVDTRSAKDFWAGHLAGARNFDPFPFHAYDSSERGTAEFRGQLAWIFSALGITTRKIVVFYEDDSGMRATRGAWALEWMGHPAAKILDGGLKVFSGEKLTREVEPFAPAEFDGTPRDDTGASLAYVVEHIARNNTQIFDVRSDAEYFAERVRAKHGGTIPGSVHLDWTAGQDDRGAFKSPEKLRELFEKLGLRPDSEIIPFCQGGYRAAHTYYALRLAGYRNVRNYWGSWGEWGNRDDVPVEHPRRK